MNEKSPSLSQKLIRNTLYNFLGRFWGILVSIALIPYIVHRIGAEKFGIFAIVGIITGYFGLLDFGVSTSFVKYISEFFAKKEYDKINQVVNTGFVFYSIVGIFVFGLFYLMIDYFLVIFKVPVSMYSEVKIVFLLGAFLFVGTNAVAVFNSVISGLQRMDITNRIAVFISFFYIIGTVFFLERGWSLLGLMINSTILFIIGSICNIFFAFKVFPALRFNPALFSKEIFKKMFGFGTKLQITTLADLISFGIDRIFIGHFLNLNLVTFYQLGATIAYKIRDVSVLVVSAVLPSVSELEAIADSRRIKELYSRSYKYILFLAMPLMVFAIFKSRLIMLTWVGPGYEYAVWALRILSVGYLLNLLGAAAATIGAGIGRPEIQMKAALLMSVMNFTLSLLGIIKFGFYGILIATSFSLVCAHIFHLFIFHRYLSMPLVSFWRKAFSLPALSCLVTLIIIYVLDFSSGILKIPHHRIFNLGILIIEFIFFMGIYLFITLKTKYIDKFDIELLSRIPLLNNLLKIAAK